MGKTRIPVIIANLLPDTRHPDRGLFPKGIPSLKELELAIPRAQSAYATVVRAATWTQTYEKTSKHKRAIMLSRAEPGAGAAFVPPPGRNFTISNVELDIYVHFVLRLPQPMLAGVDKCVCGCSIDSMGDHLFSCSELRYARKPMHDGLCRLWMEFNRKYGDRHVRNDDLDKQQHWKAYSPNHCPDVTLLDYRHGHIICDVTTTHPNCDTYLQPKEVHSSTWPLVAAEKTKDREYGEAVRNGPHKLLPLVFETYGACGPQLNKFFAQVQAREAEKAKNIGIDASNDGDRDNDEIRQERKLFFKNAPFTARSHVSYWRQRFAVSLACGVSSFIAMQAQRLALKK